MSNHLFIPVRGKRVRIVELDNCGRPLEGGEQITSDGFVSVAISAVVEEGAEVIQRKFTGALCVNEKFADSFKRFTVNMEFCGVNPAVLSKVTNAEPYEDYAGDMAGFTVPEGDIEKWFALELWTGLSGQACAEDVEEASGYFLLPFLVAGTPGDITIDGENAVTFSLNNASTKGGNTWGTGLFNVVYDESGNPAPLPVPLDPLDHLLILDTGVAPPPITDELEPLPVPAP